LKGTEKKEEWIEDVRWGSHPTGRLRRVPKGRVAKAQEARLGVHIALGGESLDQGMVGRRDSENGGKQRGKKKKSGRTKGIRGTTRSCWRGVRGQRGCRRSAARKRLWKVRGELKTSWRETTFGVFGKSGENQQHEEKKKI